MWAVTMTFDIEPLDPDTAEQLEDTLSDHDATIANLPGDGVTVTMYDSGDPIKAAATARDAASSLLGTEPVALTVEDEERHINHASRPTLPRMMSAPEVAELLGVSRQRVHQLRATPTFPAPLYELRTGPIWDAAAIEHFATTWERKPGRPRAS